MKKNLSFAMIGLALGLVCGFKVANSSYRSELKANRESEAISAGASQRNQQVNDQARAVIEQAHQNPQDFDAQHRAAEQFIQIQRPMGAIEFLTRAHQIKPDDAETMADLGEAYYLAQKFDESIDWSRRALKARPGYPLATFYLMASFVETERNLDEAEKLLGELEQLRPDDPALRQIRQILRTSKKERASSEAKNVLLHGPEQSIGGRR